MALPSFDTLKMQLSLQYSFSTAMPYLVDPFLHHSVIYIYQHRKFNHQGVMIWIINWPAQTMLVNLSHQLNILNVLKYLTNTPALSYCPVENRQGIFPYYSYATWEKGQLEQKLAKNDRLTVTTNDKMSCETPLEELWQVAYKLLAVDIDFIFSSPRNA